MPGVSFGDWSCVLPLASPHTRRISLNPDSLDQVFWADTEMLIHHSFCSSCFRSFTVMKLVMMLALAHISVSCSAGHDYCDTRTGSSKMSFLAWPGQCGSSLPSPLEINPKLFLYNLLNRMVYGSMYQACLEGWHQNSGLGFTKSNIFLHREISVLRTLPGFCCLCIAKVTFDTSSRKDKLQCLAKLLSVHQLVMN